MLLVRAETRMAGVRIRFSCNSLLWHWVMFILSVRCVVGCLALALGLTLFSCGGPKPPEATPPAGEGNPVKPSRPPSTQPPSTQPPSTQPPSTQPPSTQPPSTQPPSTQPPSTQH